MNNILNIIIILLYLINSSLSGRVCVFSIHMGDFRSSRDGSIMAIDRCSITCESYCESKGFIWNPYGRQPKCLKVPTPLNSMTYTCDCDTSCILVGKKN